LKDQPDKLNKQEKPNKLEERDKPDVMKISRFEDLDCWQEARKLTRQVYEAINRSPLWQKDMRLCGQMQDAAGSVMSNIAEGFARRSNKEFVQFLFIAISSAAEVQSRLYIAVDQKYVSRELFASIYEQADKTSRIISGLIKYLRTKQTRQTK
jgi:four helix bundle protein